jgi:hypothetical protein
VSWELLTGKVDGKQVNDELSDLHAGKVFFPPDSASTGSSIVIIV